MSALYWFINFCQNGNVIWSYIASTSGQRHPTSGLSDWLVLDLHMTRQEVEHSTHYPLLGYQYINEWAPSLQGRSYNYRPRLADR